jgi:SET domain-containing protein
MAQTKSISTTQRSSRAALFAAGRTRRGGSRRSFSDDGSLTKAARRLNHATLLEVRASRVHGLGVFATKSIRKGTRIIEYTGKRILWNDVPNDLDDPHTFLFGLDDGVHVIDPAIGGNEARWINHSCQPNCEAIEEEDERVFIYALRDLRPGEELFYDYALEMDEPVTEQLKKDCECFCGVPECRRTMLSVK